MCFSFKPPTYKDLRRKISLSSTEDPQFLEGLKTLIQKLLSSKDIDAEVQGRLKNLYSIRCKINCTGKRLQSILDQIGLRIIVFNHCIENDDYDIYCYTLIFAKDRSTRHSRRYSPKSI